MPWVCSTLLLLPVGTLECIFIALLAVFCWSSRMDIYCSVGPLECKFMASLKITHFGVLVWYTSFRTILWIVGNDWLHMHRYDMVQIDGG